jgi:hypothetical protein
MSPADFRAGNARWDVWPASAGHSPARAGNARWDVWPASAGHSPARAGSARWGEARAALPRERGRERPPLMTEAP